MSRRVTDGKLCWICSAVAPCLKWWTTKSRSTREEPTRIVPSSHALRGAGQVVTTPPMLRIITGFIDFDAVIPGGSRVAPTSRLAGPLRSQDGPWMGSSDAGVPCVRTAPRCIGAPPRAIGHAQAQRLKAIAPHNLAGVHGVLHGRGVFHLPVMADQLPP